MKEELLQFIWATLAFDFLRLKSKDEKPLALISNGKLNLMAGPDFKNAKMRMDGMEWVGDIEIHIHSEDWYRHNHHLDPAYNRVILHVVLEFGKRKIFRQDGTEIPEISLAKRIQQDVEQKFHQLLLSQERIPCSTSMIHIPKPIITGWLDRLGIERFEQKISAKRLRLEEIKGDWAQLIWEEIAAGFGGPQNGEAFRNLARVLPFHVLMKYKSKPEKMLALILGSFGFLVLGKNIFQGSDFMKRDWDFLAIKHDLSVQWQMLETGKIRPAGNPLVKAKQLAIFLAENNNLVQLVSKVELPIFFKGEVKPQDFPMPGKESMNSLVINVILPLQLLYQRYWKRRNVESKVLELFEGLKTEDNRIARLYRDAGIVPENALQSQGVIHLQREYCAKRKCLNCAIGHQILKATKLNFAKQFI